MKNFKKVKAHSVQASEEPQNLEIPLSKPKSHFLGMDYIDGGTCWELASNTGKAARFCCIIFYPSVNT